MTIQEAIKSGKPFKRKIWNFFITAKDGIGFVTEDGYPVSPWVDDILATDWETKD